MQALFRRRKLKISTDFTWTIRRGQSVVPTKECDVFDDVPHLLNSMEHILSIITLLDACKFCIGNADDKFFVASYMA